jgi:ribosomal protein L37AE/L43A
MGYAKIACCDRCGKKRYVERVNGRWLCLDCQDVVTEEQPSATKASGAVEFQSARENQQLKLDGVSARSVPE